MYDDGDMRIKSSDSVVKGIKLKSFKRPLEKYTHTTQMWHKFSSKYEYKMNKYYLENHLYSHSSMSLL